MITIGRMKLETSVPDDLDDRLVALTGCSAKEVRELLKTSPLASFVAAAIIPLLREPLERAELADRIAAAGLNDVRSEAIALYDHALKPKAAPNGKK